MSAHIVNRKLDAAGNPGTLSAPILTGILRNELGFNGVVFSDDMQMHAITEHYGLEEAIRLAIGAGIDIMTFSNNISGSDERTVDKVHSVIRDMVNKGVITEARIDASFDRIMKLKKERAIADRTIALKRELESVKAALQKTDEVLREANEALREQETKPSGNDERKSRKKNKDL
jgi:beta-N-acetylhexosaminidase